MNSALLEATYYTKSVGVALLAVIGAYVANVTAQKYMGRAAHSLIAPVTEELLKTLMAAWFAAPVLVVHASFGVIEALLDARHSDRPRIVALMAVITHLLFGTVTLLGWRYINIYAGISISVLLHMLWNSFVYDLVNLQRKD